MTKHLESFPMATLVSAIGQSTGNSNNKSIRILKTLQRKIALSSLLDEFKGFLYDKGQYQRMGFLSIQLRTCKLQYP